MKIFSRIPMFFTNVIVSFNCSVFQQFSNILLLFRFNLCFISLTTPYYHVFLAVRKTSKEKQREKDKNKILIYIDIYRYINYLTTLTLLTLLALLLFIIFFSFSKIPFFYRFPIFHINSYQPVYKLDMKSASFLSSNSGALAQRGSSCFSQTARRKVHKVHRVVFF